MDIESVASVAVITPDAAASRRLYVDALGLPLRQLDGDNFASQEIDGCQHFGVWPLSQAAEACFGTSSWPAHVAVPQMSLEFELADPRAVAEGKNFVLVATSCCTTRRRSRGDRRLRVCCHLKVSLLGRRMHLRCIRDSALPTPVGDALLGWRRGTGARRRCSG